MGIKAKKKARSTRVKSAKERAQKRSEGFSRTSIKVPEGMSIWSMKKPGTFRIDIIPYTVGKGNPNAKPGELYFERTYYTHRGIGPNGDTYVCNRKTFNGKCPICDHRAKLASKPDTDEDELKALEPRERQMFNIIDKAEPGKGIQLFESSYFLFGKQLDSMINVQLEDDEDDDGREYFADTEDGKTLKLAVEEESFNGQTFRKVVGIEFKPRKEAYDEEIIEKAACLDDLPIQMDYKKLKEIFLALPGEDAGDEGGDDEEDEKPAKKNAKGKKPAAKDDDDEDEEEPEDDEELEEPDEDEESDDEDEPEDEDDDEPEEWEPEKGQRVSVKIGKKSKEGTVTSYNPKKPGNVLVKLDGAKTADAFKVAACELLEDEEPEDDEEIEEPEDEDEDEPEEKPKGKKGKKPAAKDEDEDEEESDDDDDDGFGDEWDEPEDDDSDDEEEEEEKPKAKKKPPAKKTKR